MGTQVKAGNQRGAGKMYCSSFTERGSVFVVMVAEVRPHIEVKVTWVLSKIFELPIVYLTLKVLTISLSFSLMSTIRQRPGFMQETAGATVLASKTPAAF